MGQNPGALLVTPNWLVVMDFHPPQHIKIMNYGLTCLTNVKCRPAKKMTSLCAEKKLHVAGRLGVSTATNQC